MKWHVRCGNVMRQLVCLAGCIFLCIGIAGATDQTTAAAQQQADSQSGVLVGSLTGQSAALMDGVALDDGVGQAAAQLLDNLLSLIHI